MEEMEINPNIVIDLRYLERVRREEQDKKVMLDLFLLATKGKHIIITPNGKNFTSNR